MYLCGHGCASHLLIGKMYYQLFLDFAYIFIIKLGANLFTILVPSLAFTYFANQKTFLVWLWELTAS